MSVVTYIHATVKIPRIIGVKTTISAQKIIGCFVLKFFWILLWLLRLYERLYCRLYGRLVRAPAPAPAPVPSPALLIVRLWLEECEFRPLLFATIQSKLALGEEF